MFHRSIAGFLIVVILLAFLVGCAGSSRQVSPTATPALGCVPKGTQAFSVRLKADKSGTELFPVFLVEKDTTIKLVSGLAVGEVYVFENAFVKKASVKAGACQLPPAGVLVSRDSPRLFFMARLR